MCCVPFKNCSTTFWPSTFVSVKAHIFLCDAAMLPYESYTSMESTV